MSAAQAYAYLSAHALPPEIIAESSWPDPRTLPADGERIHTAANPGAATPPASAKGWWDIVRQRVDCEFL